MTDKGIANMLLALATITVLPLVLLSIAGLRNIGGDNIVVVPFIIFTTGVVGCFIGAIIQKSKGNYGNSCALSIVAGLLSGILFLVI